MKKFILLAAITGVAVFGAQPNAGSPPQDVQVKKVPIKHTKAGSGVDMYRSYCAACHGLSGTGDGPAAAALKVAPPDLTTLASKDGGKFPESKVNAILRGNNEISAHGSSDMPTWGPLFHSLDNGDHPVEELRIHNLTAYVKSIQK